MRAAILILCTGLAACTASKPQPVNTAKIIDTIKADEVRSNADWAAHDVAKIVSFFAPRASVILPGAPIMHGTAALTTGIGQNLNDPNFTLTFASNRVLVAKSGDLAVARGTYKQSGTVNGQAVTTAGTYVTVFRPQPDGSWKAQWDIVTPGPAAPPAPAPAK